MIKRQRHTRMLALLQVKGVASISELNAVDPEVARVTIRRDVAELAAAGLLRRTRGGAELPEPVDADSLIHLNMETPVAGDEASAGQNSLDTIDAIVLPPIDGKAADALRRQIRRRGIPFIAESGAQEGGTYVGPDDRQAAAELGVYAGRHALAHAGEQPVCLIIGNDKLPNTRARAQGFEQGLRSVLAERATLVHVDGLGSYASSVAVARDALGADPAINLIYGINDHSAVAGLDAAASAERDVAVFASGGERAEFLARVAGDDVLVAVSAMFPSVVGALAIEAIAQLFNGRCLPAVVPTPTAIVHKNNLKQYYHKRPDGSWNLRDGVFKTLVSSTDLEPLPTSRVPVSTGNVRVLPKRIAFMPHFPAHDWYRTMLLAMRQRAERYGYSVALTPPERSIADELTRLRQQIAHQVAATIRSHQTIIIGEGAATLALAVELGERAVNEGDAFTGVTVVTNSLDVLHRLSPIQGLRTIVTSGEYQSDHRCLVGPSLGALFERMRVDCAFLSVDGLSAAFGISSTDERRALVGSRFIAASRAVSVLADHTLIGAEATHRIGRIDNIDAVYTDAGSLPLDRQTLRTCGIEVHVADQPLEMEGHGGHSVTTSRQPSADREHHKKQRREA